MPFRRYKRRRYSGGRRIFRKFRKYVKRRASKRRGYTRNSKIPTGWIVPDSYYCKLRFISIDLGSVSAFPLFTIKLNSLTPNPLDGTHQYFGMDQINDFYYTYTIWGCKWNIMIQNNATNFGIEYSMVPSTVDTAFANIDQMRENPKSRYGVTGIAGATNATRWAKGYHSVAGMYGVSKKFIMDSTNFAGSSVGTDPTNILFLKFGMSSVDPTNPALNVNVKMILTCYVRFYDRKILPPS